MGKYLDVMDGYLTYNVLSTLHTCSTLYMYRLFTSYFSGSLYSAHCSYSVCTARCCVLTVFQDLKKYF